MRLRLTQVHLRLCQVSLDSHLMRWRPKRVLGSSTLISGALQIICCMHQVICG